MKQDGYKEVARFITEIEQKYNLFSLQQDKVYYWKLIRVPLMLHITNQKNNLTSAHSNNNNVKKYSRLIGYLVEGSIKNPFFINKNTSKIFLENPRKIKYNESFIDPYTHFHIMNNSNYHVLENVYKLKRSESVYNPSSSVQLVVLLQNVKKFFMKKQPLTNENIKVLTTIEQDIYKAFELKIPLKKLAINKLLNFKSGFFAYNLLFKRKYWSELFIVCSYGKEYIIAAAKKNGIKVVEFQHGVMGPYHLGYHFPKVEEVPYFPDELLLYGDFWTECTSFPKSVELISYGFPYLNDQITKLQSAIKEKNLKMITVISQGTIGKKLSEIVLEAAKELEDYHISYKLHPGEFGRWTTEYPALLELSKLENVKIYENEKSLYSILAESNYTIGVYSTALFEAIAFESIPITIKLPGYEYINDFRKLYNLEIFQESTEIVNYLKTRGTNTKEIFNSEKSRYLWSSNVESNIL